MVANQHVPRSTNGTIHGVWSSHHHERDSKTRGYMWVYTHCENGDMTTCRNMSYMANPRLTMAHMAQVGQNWLLYPI
jgi:hypothetical protein